MSDEPVVYTSTSVRAHKSAPLTPAQRKAKQEAFLAVYRGCGNITYTCSVVGIDRKTFYNWRDRSGIFKQALEDAEPEVDDTVEYAAMEEGVIGVLEPVVSMGQPVYRSEPMIDEDGNQKYDNKGKPMMQRGEMLMVRKRNPTVLITLLKARMPHKYREKQQMELIGKDGGPIVIETQWGTSKVAKQGDD